MPELARAPSLTAKHVHPSGAEDVHPAISVRYDPGTITEPATLWIRQADDSELPLTGGRVYVMNDAGKTVASYNLFAPIGGPPAKPAVSA